MSRKSSTLTGTIAYVVKDGEEQTIDVGLVGSIEEAWIFAHASLHEKQEAKRIVFFDRDFTFVNALNRPGYLRYEDDVIAEDDRQELQRMLDEFERPSPERPEIVCLCGSTRFSQAFHDENLRQTLLGKIVLSIGCDFKSDADLLIAGDFTEEDKERLDELHLRKIDLADTVYILNVGGYIGNSTRRELRYAMEHRKRIKWLEPPVEPE